MKDDSGKDVRLTEIPRPFVLYFYPKADTPGCTSEGGQFRDLYDQFKAKGTEIIGVSRDTVEAQHAFKVKYSFPFRLLADVDSKICDAFGTLVERERDGVKSKGVARATFLIGKDGKVEKSGRPSPSRATAPTSSPAPCSLIGGPFSGRF